MVFGEAVDTIYDFSAADVVVALDADFLSHPAAGLRYTRDFMNRRSAPLRADGNLTTSGHPSGTNRLYAAECMPSIMGAVADHRLPMARPDSSVRGAGRRSGDSDAPSAGEFTEGERNWISAAAKNLQQYRSSSIVIAGDGQPPLVHALAQVMNDVLGNVGQTVRYIDPVASRPSNSISDLATLTQDMGRAMWNCCWCLAAIRCSPPRPISILPGICRKSRYESIGGYMPTKPQDCVIGTFRQPIFWNRGAMVEPSMERHRSSSR